MATPTRALYEDSTLICFLITMLCISVSDEGPFKPPELSDIDALSTTTSELSRAVRAYNDDYAEQERTNMPGFKSGFFPTANVFPSINETGEVCSVAGVSI